MSTSNVSEGVVPAVTVGLDLGDGRRAVRASHGVGSGEDRCTSLGGSRPRDRMEPDLDVLNSRLPHGSVAAAASSAYGANRQEVEREAEAGLSLRIGGIAGRGPRVEAYTGYRAGRTDTPYP